jgi:hypothetical protein
MPGAAICQIETVYENRIDERRIDEHHCVAVELHHRSKRR